MNFRLSRAGATAAVFIVVSVTSAVYVSLAAANYLAYFPALGRLSSHVSSVTFLDGSEGPRFSADVTVDNPSDYSGFTVGDMTLQFLLEHGNGSNPQSFNETLFADQPLSSSLRANRDLGPHSQIQVNMIFRLNQQESASFSSFNQTYQGHLFVHANLTVDVLTFLRSLTGATVLSLVTDLPLTG